MIKSIAVLLTCYNCKEKILKCFIPLYNVIKQVTEYNFDIFLVNNDLIDRIWRLI